MTKSQKFFSALGRFIKNFFTQNILLKIVVLLFSILLWGFVIAEENPEYTKRIYAVEIETRGEDTLQSKGWMLVDRGTASTDVDVKCEINKHRLLDASRVDCYIDLSRISAARTTDEDTLTIPFDVKCEVASDFGSVDGCTVERVEVTLAKTQTLYNQTVEVDTTGTLPDNLIIDLPQNVTIASLTGQQSQVSKISKMKVTVDLSEFANMDPGVYDVNLPVQFYQKGSNQAFDFITSSGENLTTGVHVTLRACKEVPIVVKVSTSEEFDELFDYQTRLTDIETVTLCADRRETLDAIEYVETEPIIPKLIKTQEIKNCTVTAPEGTTLLSGVSRMTASVLFSVTEKEITEEFEVPIAYSRTKDSVYLSGEERKTVTIRVSGTVADMKALNRGWFTASLSIENYLQGTIRLPIRIAFAGDTSIYRYELIDPEDGVVEIVLLPVPQTPAEP